MHRRAYVMQRTEWHRGLQHALLQSCSQGEKRYSSNSILCCQQVVSFPFLSALHIYIPDCQSIRVQGCVAWLPVRHGSPPSIRHNHVHNQRIMLLPCCGALTLTKTLILHVNMHGHACFMDARPSWIFLALRLHKHFQSMLHGNPKSDVIM